MCQKYSLKHPSHQENLKLKKAIADKELNAEYTSFLINKYINAEYKINKRINKILLYIINALWKTDLGLYTS